MNKLIIISIILIISFSVFAQKPGKPYSPGDELIVAQRHRHTGFALYGASVALSLLSLPTQEITPLYLGGIVAVIGVIYTIESWVHVGKAGRKLNEKFREIDQNLSGSIKPTLEIGLINGDLGIRYRF